MTSRPTMRILWGGHAWPHSAGQRRARMRSPLRAASSPSFFIFKSEKRFHVLKSNRSAELETVPQPAVRLCVAVRGF